MGDKADKPEESSGLGWWQKILYIIYFVGFFLILSFLLLKFWPSPSGEAQPMAKEILLGPVSLKISEEVQLILVVALTGALGGCAFSANSFASHVGKGSFKTSYTCWYILRPIVSSILAVIFYFAFRGAFLSLSASTQDLDIFGIAALGGIVGLFSKETLDKLKELFDRILPTGQG